MLEAFNRDGVQGVIRNGVCRARHIHGRKAGDRTRRVYSITQQGRREEERKEQAIASFINSIIYPALEHNKKVPGLMLYGFLSPMSKPILEDMPPEHRRIAIDQLKEIMRSDLQWLETISDGEKDD